ncbi:zinc finger protein 282-like [Calypte anna]|uniref:zinc finger protein 282-like n=1 Tax=Calypte anna TaxID=9244 RepID=UPI0011C44D54|nr:zinc finger protein 282-like [Calypte anna]
MAGLRVGRAEAVSVPVSVRVLRLEVRLARAERQLSAALALRGRLRALERRLENGGGCGAPGRGAGGTGVREAGRARERPVPVSLEDVWVQFSKREWRALRGWQRALHRAVLRSTARTPRSSRTPRSAGKGPDATGSGRERARGWEREVGKVPCGRDPPAEPPLPPPAGLGAPGGDARDCPERGNRACAGSCGDTDGRGDPAETGDEDSSIRIKQEEELCGADQQEREAGEEPCPEEVFYDPEAPSQARSSRELPGPEDLPRDPDTGFQTYGTDVLSWIKQEEEPCTPDRQGLGREGICAAASTVPDGSSRRAPQADCFETPPSDSETPGRPGEKFSKDLVPRVPWDAHWGSEMMETTSSRSSLGGDPQPSRGFAEHLGVCSPQENVVGRGPHGRSERNPHQQGDLQPPQAGEMCPGPTSEGNLSARVFHPLHPQPCAPEQKDSEPGAAPPSCTQGTQNPPGATRPRDPPGGEQLPLESQENFPRESHSGSPCWEEAEERGRQQQGRGKSYICSHCGKSFVCHSWLVRHRMTHTGERPYKCSECDKSYRRKDYLLNHQRRHSGQGLLQCPLCGKSFVLRRSFLKHQESHVQEPPLGLGGWSCAELRGPLMHPL